MPSRTPSHVCLKKIDNDEQARPDEKAEAVKSAGTSGVLRNRTDGKKRVKTPE